MNITFHGAAHTVTGSQHLIEVNGQRFLLDCGLFQGKRKESFERNRNFAHDPSKLDSVVLSHAHIDHSGNLPSLSKLGYECPVFATHATDDMCQLMLRDSAYIQEMDVRYVNKRRRRKGQNLFEPLYSTQNAEHTLKLFNGQNYDTSFDVVPGVAAQFHQAGHILGSASVSLIIEDGSRKLNVVFSGDIGRRRTPILRDPAALENCDVLIMESTYGNRLHGPRDQIDGKLRDIVNRICNTGGKLIIPAFAVGRTQEIVYTLHRLMDSGEIPRLPVFVDSPLATNVSQVYRRHKEIFDQETLAFIGADAHNAALSFPELTYTASVEESKAINEMRGPMVIISASGMAEAGRILHHLRHNIGDPNSTVLIVSWQAPHTLGRRLVEKQEVVKIFGKQYTRRAQVATVNGLSAHADRDGLLNWVRAVVGRIEHIFLVHGEPEPAAALREQLLDIGANNVHIPALHESATL